MTGQNVGERIHDLDVTLWVGKSGIEPAIDELTEQLDDHDLVKAKFLRSARGGTDTETLAGDLAEAANAELVQTRGHTAVFR